MNCAVLLVQLSAHVATGVYGLRYRRARTNASCGLALESDNTPKRLAVNEKLRVSSVEVKRLPADMWVNRTSTSPVLDSGSYFHYNVIEMIGEFEYLLLSAAARLGEEAYGASIRQQIETATGRRCSIGALYTTLDRLEEKGLLKTWMGQATPQRGGRAKRMVHITAKGVQAATAFYNAVLRMSQGVSWAKP